MNINKLPIFSTDEHKLCHITYPDRNREWTLHTGDGITITTLIPSPCGFYAQFEAPCEKFDLQSDGMEYRINTEDTEGILCPDPGEKECMKLSDKRIRNASGKQVCKVSFNEEDDTWGVAFYGEPYTTTLYPYFNGSYTQVEIPAEADLSEELLCSEAPSQDSSCGHMEII